MRVHSRFVAVLLVLASATAAAAQEAPRRGVYFELLGNGGVLSINYEQRLRPRVAGRIGVGAWAAEDFWSDNEVTVVSFPVTVSWITGDGNHHLESGGGILVGHKSETRGPDGPFASLTGIFGYRYQKPQGGFLFRAGLTPFIPLNSGERAYPDDGAFLSFGISFGGSW
jgi:hypothetical protein